MKFGTRLFSEHLTPRQRILKFKEETHQLVEAVANYYLTLEERNPKPNVQPFYLQNLLGKEPPLKPLKWEETLHHFNSSILDGAVHWQHPKFLAYFPSMTNFAAIQGEIISRAINAVGFSWSASPVNTEMEVLMADWVAKAIGLPFHFLHESKQGGGLTHGTASEAILAVLIAARDSKPGKNPLVYVSEQTHSVVAKNARLLGIELRKIPAPWNPEVRNYPMDASALNNQILEDKLRGFNPIFVCGTIGTTNSTAIDPITEIGKVAKEHNIWFHVDAAYSGSAMVCPEYKYLLEGVDYCDSFNFNGSKWLGTGFNCAFLYVKDKSQLIKTFSMNAEYLKSVDAEKVDFKDWQIPLGRDCRAFKVWTLFSQYGIEGIQTNIRNHVKLAQMLEELILADPRFELATKRELALVVCKLAQGDTSQLVKNLEEKKEVFLVGSQLGGESVLRISPASEFMQPHHVEEIWNCIVSCVP